MKRAGGVRVEDAAGVGGAGSGRGGRGGQRGAGRVRGRRRGFRLALRDAAVADFPWLLLQGRGMSHGTWPWIRGTNTRGLERVAVLLGLKRQKISTKIKRPQDHLDAALQLRSQRSEITSAVSSAF